MSRPYRIPDELALRFKRLYEDDGWTVERLALEHEYNSGTVYRALKRVNTQMRTPYQRTPKNAANRLVDGIKGKQEPAIKQGSLRKGSFIGHRRRGKL